MTSTAQELHPAPVLEPGRTILELRGLEKRYPGTQALKPVSLAFKAAEIHAIVGENGAGKSTLIKLLTGVMPRTSGEVIWEGKPEALASPHEAMALGINAVHQEVVLCRHLTVAANMFLGEEDRPLRSPAAAGHGQGSAEDHSTISASTCRRMSCSAT